MGDDCRTSGGGIVVQMGDGVAKLCIPHLYDNGGWYSEAVPAPSMLQVRAFSTDL